MPQNKSNLPDKLAADLNISIRWTSDVYANPVAWMNLSEPSILPKLAEALCGKFRLCTITAYPEERADPDKRRRIVYHFAAGNTVLNVTVNLYDPKTLQKLPAPSISSWFRNASWNEREFMEMFNIEVSGRDKQDRLFLDERLDAGIMTQLIPFSALANSAGTNTLFERVLEAKGVPPEERLPSIVPVREPISVEPKVTPVSATAPKIQTDKSGSMTLLDVASPAEDIRPANSDSSGN